VRKVLFKKLKVKRLVIGYDHRFGKQREGSFDDLKKMAPKYGFDVEEITEEDVNDIAVSSTQVRNALKKGDIDIANAFLGRPYSLTGTVIHGNKIGRTIGFPTANLQIPETYKLIPAEGVYVVEVELKNEIHFGLLSIGRRPTLENSGNLSIEVYIIDFDREIYGSEITLKLLRHVRDDRKFNSLDELTKQINNDMVFALSYLAERN
jgi:riboflavin kinase/FMN adenylyltransferase